MLETWANDVVVCALGLGIGVTAGIIGHVAPQGYREAGRSPRRRGENVWQAARRRNREQDEILRTGDARPMRIAAAASFGFAAVLVLTVWLSPVRLGWGPLFLSALAGIAAVEVVYFLARTQRLRPSRFALLDPLSARAPERETGTG
jgi:hypothetical protein